MLFYYTDELLFKIVYICDTDEEANKFLSENHLCDYEVIAIEFGKIIIAENTPHEED